VDAQKKIACRFQTIETLQHCLIFSRIVAAGRSDSESDSRCHDGEKVVAVVRGGGGRQINVDGDDGSLSQS
jgi:hypothetical protein